jgi:hypothetical protein
MVETGITVMTPNEYRLHKVKKKNKAIPVTGRGGL